MPVSFSAPRVLAPTITPPPPVNNPNILNETYARMPPAYWFYNLHYRPAFG